MPEKKRYIIVLFSELKVQVVLCGNNVITENRATTVITHELIHAFDDCRAKVDFKDIRHLACTEVGFVSIQNSLSQIRAASLSGDCFFTEEFFNRFNFGLAKQHQVLMSLHSTLCLLSPLSS